MDQAALPPKADTALHWGKDFAVSLPHCYGIVPDGTPRLSLWTSLLAPLGLLQTGVTRYLAPVKNRECPDFPLR